MQIFMREKTFADYFDCLYLLYQDPSKYKVY